MHTFLRLAIGAGGKRGQRERVVRPPIIPMPPCCAHADYHNAYIVPKKKKVRKLSVCALVKSVNPQDTSGMLHLPEVPRTACI